MTNDFGNDQGKTDAAKEHAADLKDHAIGAGQELGDQAKVEAKSVVQDAQNEAAGLFDNVRSQTQSQLRDGQNRLAEGVRAVAKEVGEMADGSQQNGQATSIARTISRTGEDAAQWLETHEAEDVLYSVQRYAARNPMTFLAIAAGAGLLVGRLARGFQAEQSDQRSGYDRRQEQTFYEGHGSTFGQDPRQRFYDEPRYGNEPRYDGSGMGRPTDRPQTMSGYGDWGHREPGLQDNRGADREQGFGDAR